MSSVQVDAIFAPWNRTDSPGCALAVMDQGHIVYEHGYGMADLEHDATITGTTPFHVASISKQFTATAILLLAQQGKLSLDDDVHKYLPELGSFGAPITLRNLLHHTSGLRDQWDLLQLAGYRYSLDLITDQDVMSLVTRQRQLNFAPGSQYLYSNTGFTLLGQIVKRVSGQSLREFTTSRIFEPLNMRRTYFRDDHAGITRGEALGYERSANGAFRLSVTNFDTTGATSLYTTAEDLAKWDENFYHPTVGGNEFARLMTQTDRLTTGARNRYALGLFLGTYRGLPIVEHSGADAGYRADILRFPEQHFSVACLCNTPVSVDTLSRAVADLYLTSSYHENIPVRFAAGIKPAAVDLSGKEGYYRSRDLGVLMRLAVADGMLQFWDNRHPQSLLTDGKGTFQPPDSTDFVRFEPARGAARRMIVTRQDDPPQIWDRLPAFSADASAASAYVGRYESEELDVVYEIAESGGKLHLNRQKHLDDELLPVGPDSFADPGLPSGRALMDAVSFARDASGHISGMSVTVARSHNLWFSRQAAPNLR